LGLVGRPPIAGSEPKWSPSGEWLAFVSDVHSGAEKSDQDQVFVWSKKTAVEAADSAQRRDRFAGWSPDGKAIGFPFCRKRHARAGALAAMSRGQA